MLFFVAVHGAGLTVEHKQVLGAIARVHLVRDPEFDQTGGVKITETKIQDQRRNLGQGNIPRADLFLEAGKGFLLDGPRRGDFQAFF